MLWTNKAAEHMASGLDLESLRKASIDDVDRFVGALKGSQTLSPVPKRFQERSNRGRGK